MVCVLPCFQCLMAFVSKKCQHWKAGVQYRLLAAIWNKAFFGLQRGGVQKQQRPGRLWARSQAGPEARHIALCCPLAKNIFWNGECRYLALDFPNSRCAQRIFLLMKAEQVPLSEQNRLFCAGGYGDTLNVRMCWQNIGKHAGCYQRLGILEEHGR